MASATSTCPSSFRPDRVSAATTICSTSHFKDMTIETSMRTNFVDPTP